MYETDEALTYIVSSITDLTEAVHTLTAAVLMTGNWDHRADDVLEDLHVTADRISREAVACANAHAT